MLTLRALPPAIVLLAALSGCVNSTGSCPKADTRDEERELRSVEKLIRDTRTGIARGYREETTYGYGGGFVDFCLGGGGSNVGIAVCGDPTRRKSAVPIDSAAEERKLAALEARRGALVSEINAKSAACTAAGGQ
jgi:hypothetical protein